MNSRLCISFSGGRTSAYMAKRLVERTGPSAEIITVFANTGRENEATLKFVDRCDREFGLNVVWVEAAVDPEHGTGTGCNVVNFDTASRSGEPFEAVIQKYGIPNPNFRHCNRELKLNPIRAYLRSIGWEAGTYDTAVGVRADEMDRMSKDAKANRIIYPLVRWGVRKSDVRSWWLKQAFDLELEEHWGNCETCWKKSDRKLLTVAAECPSAFEFFRRMEATYPDAGPGDYDRPRHFFRKGRSAEDMLALSRKPFRRYRPETEIQTEMDMLDLEGSCGESCEIFADEMPMDTKDAA